MFYPEEHKGHTVEHLVKFFHLRVSSCASWWFEGSLKSYLTENLTYHKEDECIKMGLNSGFNLRVNGGI